jgi:alcohol dehydrogenase class IV
MNLQLQAADAALRPFDIDWWPNRVVFQVGAIERIRDLVLGLGRRRAMIVCGRSVAASPTFSRVQLTLGDLFVGAVTDTAMHSPLPVLERAADDARSVDADAVISIGGGSAIDSGKGICLIHGVGQDYAAYAMKPGQPAKALPELALAHIAVPTTTGSGSEVAPTCGLRDPALGHKRIFRDRRLIPAIALLDPQATVETPARLTAASGATALARAIEALYSGRRNPIHSGLALQALRLIFDALPRSLQAPADLDARARCQIAASLSAIAANANVSAVHAIGHIVGGRYGLQHGLTHAILLAPTMRLLLPSIGDTQLEVLEATGGASRDPHDAGRKAADAVAQLVVRLELPTRLRDLGVPEGDLDLLAEQASRDPIMLTAAAPVSRAAIADLLRSVW